MDIKYDNPTPKWKQSRDRLLNQIVDNPKTTIAGLATIGAALLPKHSIQIGLIAAGIGNILSKDGDKAATKPSPEADAAITKVEQLPPNTEIKP